MQMAPCARSSTEYLAQPRGAFLPVAHPPISLAVARRFVAPVPTQYALVLNRDTAFPPALCTLSGTNIDCDGAVRLLLREPLLTLDICALCRRSILAEPLLKALQQSLALLSTQR